METPMIEVLEWEARDRKITTFFMVVLAIVIWGSLFFVFEFNYPNFTQFVSVRYRIFMWLSLLFLFVAWALVFETFEFRISEVSHAEKEHTETNWKSILSVLFWLAVLGMIMLVDWRKLGNIRLSQMNQVIICIIGLITLFYLAGRITGSEKKLEEIRKSV